MPCHLNRQGLKLKTKKRNNHVKFGTFSCNLVQFCTFLYNLVQFGRILCNLVQFGKILCNLAPTNIWHHKDRCNFVGAKYQFFFWHCQHLLHWCFHRNMNDAQVILISEGPQRLNVADMAKYIFYLGQDFGRMVSLKFISQNFRRTHFGVSPGQIIWSMNKLAFWNSAPDNTLGARNYSCCSWNSVRAVPRVTSLWWPPGPRAVSKLLNWWYMQQHNLRELAVFSQNVFFQLSKYLPISRRTRMI